jgi:hypothetical protein
MPSDVNSSYNKLRAPSVFLQLRYAFARIQHSLHHEVRNVTIDAIIPAPVTITTVYTTTEICLTPTSTRSIYSIIFPSPDASPIEITAQSTFVTSFFPEMTWCLAPPIAILPVTGSPYANGTANYTTTIKGTGSCETMYAPIETVSNSFILDQCRKY